MRNTENSKSGLKASNLPISFCLNPAYDEQKMDVFSLKIQGGDFWELNIELTKKELESITEIKNAHWDERRSLKLGKCLNSPVFWCRDNEIFSILIGNDDEVWEVGASMSESVINDLIKEIDYVTANEIIENTR